NRAEWIIQARLDGSRKDLSSFDDDRDDALQTVQAQGQRPCCRPELQLIEGNAATHPGDYREHGDDCERNRHDQRGERNSRRVLHWRRSRLLSPVNTRLAAAWIVVSYWPSEARGIVMV